MKRLILFVLLLTQILVASLAHAGPVIPPKPSGADMFVQDYADVISPTDRAMILSIGKELEEKTTAQVVVLTIKSLDKQPIEAYALDVLRAWGIGSHESNNGVLMVVSTDDKQSRIEVGYGLEGVLPDGLTGRIQDENMLPFFQQGNYSKGILQGYAAIVGTIAKEANVQITGVKYSGQAETTGYSLSSMEKLLIGVGITALLLLDNFLLGGVLTQMLLLAFLFGRGGRNDGGLGGGSGGGGGSSRKW